MAEANRKSIIDAHISGSAKAIESLNGQTEPLERAIDALVSAIRSGGRLYCCGNGGSACQAMHLEEELVARYERERPGIPVSHLCDGGTITCWANDYEFSQVFERQVNTFVTSNDVLLVLSTSGNSKNILRALESAKKKGAKTIGLLGREGGKAKAMVDFPIVVGGPKTAHIQEAHLVIIHIICNELEVRLFNL